MTQFGAPLDEFESTAEPRTSRLAIASLVCSLICCVPVTTIPGILLGIWAMLSINNNPARLKGKGLAVSGILLGVVFTAGHAYVDPKVVDLFVKMAEMVTGGPNDALTDGFAGDTTAFKSHFYGKGARASDAEAQAFIDAIRSRYGEFQGCEFDQRNQPPPSYGQPSTTFAYILTFDNAAVDCRTQIIWADERTSAAVFQLGWIKITDPDLGDLTYPAKTPRPAPETETETPDPVAPPATDAPATAPAEAPQSPDEGDGA